MRRLTTGTLVLLAAACGQLPGIDAGTGTCSTDSNCATTEMCHPVAKICVKTCSGTADCPSTSQTCATVSGSTAKVCQCTSDGMCGLSQVCQPFGLCTSKCTASSGCPSGVTCNTTTGVCGGGNTDAGTCTFGSCTAAGEFCNATNKCESKTCSATAASQPDVCGYGNYCTSGTKCANAPKGTCSNIPSSHASQQWTPSRTGPVIYASADVADDAAACRTTAVAYTAELQQYDDTDWPAQLSAVNGDLTYFPTTGATQGLKAGQRPSNYMPTGKYLKFKITLCRDGAMTGAITGGFNWPEGNPYCHDFAGGTVGTTP